MSQDEQLAPEPEETPRRRLGAAMLLEFASIVVGLLLALGLSEWADEREHRQLANAALDNVYAEVERNRTVLKIIHENNSATVASIVEDEDSAEDRQFIPGIQLEDTAWSTFIETGLSAYASYDEVLRMSNVYSLQEVYAETGRFLIQASMTSSAFAAASGVEIDNDVFAQNFLEYFSMLATVEEQLITAYDSIEGKK